MFFKKIFFSLLFALICLSCKQATEQQLPSEMASFIGHLNKDAKGEWFSFDGPFTSKEEIDAKIKSHGLQEKVDKVIKNLNK